MIGDLIIRWMTETGRGSIRDLRSRLEWAGRTSDIAVSRTETGRWLRDISSLGYAELDWASDLWTVSPTVVTRLPGPDGFAVVVGSRTAATEQLADSLNVAVHRLPQPGTGSDLDRPTTLLLQYDSPAELREVARSLGARYVPCAAQQLAAVLPKPRLGKPAAAPSMHNATVERFDPARLDWFAQQPALRYEGGLYRLDNLGRKQHLYLDTSTGWHHCDLAAGVFAELSRAGASVMRWRPDPEPGRDGQGTVFTDWGAPLPPLQQRALVLCTGWVPRFSSGARTATYENVPIDVAQLVAASLGQELQAA